MPRREWTGEQLLHEVDLIALGGSVTTSTHCRGARANRPGSAVPSRALTFAPCEGNSASPSAWPTYDVYDVHAVRAVLRAAGLPARLPDHPGQSVFIQVVSERQQTLAVHVLSEDRAFLDVHLALQVARPRDA